MKDYPPSLVLKEDIWYHSTNTFLGFFGNNFFKYRYGYTYVKLNLAYFLFSLLSFFCKQN
ncbi:hypothetical protein BCR42DRAFT_418009 [Absidia repens]|uniref:Uncharacterized protein n=1 Tax=Absidia repens TaxID=90262 RepID=A0A1X2ICX5_9FUNG|nr:hypothetical protein BCR42DRAFT_418009 [Absidia repens]